jgi:6,7-dimethyl-8-ribityllumazine synthase
VSAKKPGIAIIAAEFNKPLIGVMIATAKRTAAELGAEVRLEVSVPGSYEMPLVARRAIVRADIDALVVLGYIERGETQHGEVMGHVVHTALVNLSLEHLKPVAFGVIGPGATPEQAETRKEAYAAAAVRAAMRALEVSPSL